MAGSTYGLLVFAGSKAPDVKLFVRINCIIPLHCVCKHRWECTKKSQPTRARQERKCHMQVTTERERERVRGQTCVTTMVCRSDGMWRNSMKV